MLYYSITCFTDILVLRQAPVTHHAPRIRQRVHHLGDAQHDAKHGRREFVLWSAGGMLLSTGFITLVLIGCIATLAAPILVVDARELLRDRPAPNPLAPS